MQYLETAQGAKSRVPSCEATSTLVNICILYTTLHHFLSISLDEQRIRMSHMLLLCKIIVCTKMHDVQNNLSHTLLSQCGIRYTQSVGDISNSYIKLRNAITS